MELEHNHSDDDIAERLSKSPKPSYVRDWVYGGIDGAVTTFAIVAGVVGANLSTGIILILGLANLIADGLSMAASNYSGVKTDIDDLKRLREIERRHIRLVPEGERAEVREMFRKKGLEGRTLDEAVIAITSDEERWIETMLVEEYGVSPTPPVPIKAALATFFAFLICGAMPLVPFFMGMESAFTVSTVLTAVVFFLIGTGKSRWSLASWWHSGLETLAIGLAAASAAYLIGNWLQALA